jgi:cyclic pyranopterin phosphate synthase
VDVPKPDLRGLDVKAESVLASPRFGEVELHVGIATSTVLMEAATASKVAANTIAKGDVLGCARIAGIQAAKRASELIPSVLPVLVGGVRIEFRVLADRIEIEAIVEAVDRNGVSMQALTACAVAGLTIYDMCKAIDRSMIVTDLAVSLPLIGTEPS